VAELSKLPGRWVHRPWEAPAPALDDAGVVLGESYPVPIVDHQEQRDRALAMYREADG
jgi:deoxyribodipyrimidine photo-lyase